MKNTGMTILTVAVLSLVLALASPALAKDGGRSGHDGDGDHGGRGGDNENRVQIEVRHQGEAGHHEAEPQVENEAIEEVNENQIEAEPEVENPVEEVNEVEVNPQVQVAAEVFPSRVEIKGQEFKFIGEITAISDNTFMVAGQTVTIDPTQVGEFEQRGILSLGEMVRVEGMIIDGTNFASEIRVLTGNEQEQ